MPPEQKPIVALPRNQFIALVIGVCVLSAAIASGLALLARTGPEGPAGKQGPRGHAGKQGPPGPAGESAEEELDGLEAEVGELRGEVEGLGGGSGEVGKLEERVEALEEELEGFSGLAKGLCSEGSFVC